jgi:hypothetical protein
MGTAPRGDDEMSHWSDILRKCEANAEMIWWAATQPNAETAWRVCTRGDWMLRLLGRKLYRRKTPKHRALVAICCECERLALSHMRPGELLQSLQAIEAAERYARGEAISREDLHAANAANAAYDAYATDATNAAYAAAYSAAAIAVYAASNVAYAGYVAANAANAAYVTSFSTYADYDAARAAARAQCADIVRKHHPKSPR